jgi:hypothetical protein
LVAARRDKRGSRPKLVAAQFLFGYSHIMRLLFASLVLGVGFELTLLGVFLSSQGCVPDGCALFAVAAHYPAVWLSNHGVPFPYTLILAVILAIVVWTGVAYIFLRLFKKLFKKHDTAA